MNKIKYGEMELNMGEPDFVNAHKHSIRNRAEITDSQLCGCFACLSTCKPDQVIEWIDNGQTALCPRCGIDSVIGTASGYPVNPEFLRKMNEYWFHTKDE